MNIALLTQSLERLCSSEQFAERLLSGVRFGARWERPLQFYLAYEIERTMHLAGHQDLFVVCEKDWVDIGVRRLVPDTLEWALELKAWGSWWVTASEIDAFKSDIDKVEKTTIPAVALVACVFADSSKIYEDGLDWISELRYAETRVVDSAELSQRLAENNVTNLIQIMDLQLHLCSSQRPMSIWCGAHCNKAALGSMHGGA